VNTQHCVAIWMTLHWLLHSTDCVSGSYSSEWRACYECVFMPLLLTASWTIIHSIPASIANRHLCKHASDVLLLPVGQCWSPLTSPFSQAPAPHCIVWHNGRTLVFYRRTFAVLRSTCSWPFKWLNRPLQVSQPGLLSLSSFWGR